eukprot:3215864-Rhodomonas_salina.1
MGVRVGLLGRAPFRDPQLEILVDCLSTRVPGYRYRRDYPGTVRVPGSHVPGARYPGHECAY